MNILFIDDSLKEEKLNIKNYINKKIGFNIKYCNNKKINFKL